jgi:hypothetical protein
MQINLKQIFGISIAILGVLMISTAQLTDLMGAGAAKTVTSLAALLNSILGSVMAVITSDSQSAKDVSGIKGVEVKVSRDAPQSIAALAMDPTQDSIAPAAGEDAAVKQVAAGAAV